MDRALEMEGTLDVSVGSTVMSVSAKGSVIEVAIPNAAGAREVLDALPSLPEASTALLLEFIQRSSLVVHLMVGGQKVAELGAGSNLLLKAIGMPGVKVNLWASLRALVKPDG